MPSLFLETVNLRDVRMIQSGERFCLALVGEGGMGKVYRATDTNLKRAVAIKVLPDGFASNPERVARFRKLVAGACNQRYLRLWNAAS